MSEPKKRAYQSETRDPAPRLAPQTPAQPNTQGQPARKSSSDQKYHKIVVRLIDFLESMEA